MADDAACGIDQRRDRRRGKRSEDEQREPGDGSERDGGRKHPFILVDRGCRCGAISASPESTVVSGRADGVDEMSGTWVARGIEVRRVNTDVAFHSPAMDALTGELARLTGGLSPSRPPVVPLYSTALADPRSPAARDSEYWVTNLRGRVRFWRNPR